MRRRQELPPHVVRLIADQSGVVASSQLRAAGLSWRVIDRLRLDWERVSDGIYLTREPVWLSAAWAGLLRAGPEGVLGSRAAAFLHGMLRDEPRDVVVWGSHGRTPFPVGDWPLIPRRGSRQGRGELRRTSVDDTLLDLARDSDRHDLIGATTRALAQRLTTPERILAALDGRDRVRHSDLLRRLCADGGIESVLEWVFLTDVVRAHRLPAPTRQVVLGEGRVDNVYEEFGVIVELDGMRDHLDWSKDMFRDNAHAVRLGAITLRYGWTSTGRQPCAVADQLGEALTTRGWRGTVRACRQCPA